ncbi:penicillin-binding protein 1B [Marinithermofilum abyssi]|uniref:Penicillin-binding protein 1B n=1 Tax=Marinithermofilum abyssi TaxID=1571185 RepID=A0A8J2VH19_9BACL|nr:transglycosylase domain-containing protein [Marinithermofilum abyssi]GGE19757.1 penicillin-binding protein 1B [Marinithermofilum abyssi]
MLWKRLVKKTLTALGILFLILLTGAVTAAGVTASYLAAWTKKEPVWVKADLERKLENRTQTSHAYFRDHTPIGSLRADADRKLVTLDQVSNFVKAALIATEDKEFYHHHGIVLRSLLRAAYQNVTHDPQATGGSTITQQLVKNVILENRDKVFERKAKEILIALRLERLFPKESIFTYYLNSLFFGKGANQRNLMGIQAAAKGIFGVDAKDLNLPQAAYLAGMVQRPNAYNPFDEASLERGMKRMQTVLKRMRSNGSINARQYQEALAFDLKSSLAPKKANAYQRYPFIMDEVEEEAAKILMKAEGQSAEALSRQGLYRSTLERYRQQVLTGGYKITTTLDPRLFEAMNRTARDERLYAKPVTYTVNVGGQSKTIQNAREEVGAALIDVKTGALLSFVGGRDFMQSQTNHALDSRRQPGSTIKPLLDYGPALDQQRITPGTVLVDEPLVARDPRQEKTYKNYNDKYMGPVTARKALKLSLNIPAIKVLREIGVDNGLDYLRKMDFPVLPMDGEASAIGGFTRGFTVEKVTSGYAMLASGGLYREPYLIESIEDAKGHLLYRHQDRPVRILSPEAAYLTTDMLRDVIRSGTGRYVGVRSPGHDLAGKTGTTQNGHDVWFLGYTPRIALGVWVGYDYNHPLPNDRRAKMVWSRLFRSIQQTRPQLSPAGVRFAEPGRLTQVEMCSISGQRATEHCRNAGEATVELLPEKSVPQETCTLHDTVRIVIADGQRMAAQDQTPEDLVQTETGIRVPKDTPWLEHFTGVVLPEASDDRVSHGNPASPSVRGVSTNGSVTLTWGHTGEPSVAGYHVYRDGQRVASLPLGCPLMYSGPAGHYEVKAVDVAGLESEPATPLDPSDNPLEETKAKKRWPFFQF